MYKVVAMCSVLRASRSGYYAWCKRRPSRRRIDHEELLGRIRQVNRQSRGLYGSPRITVELKEQGYRCGKNRVARIVRDHGICGEVKKRRFRRTTDSRHAYALAANLLVGRRQTEGVWSSDITFVPTSEGWLYVAVLMNVKSRRVIGLSTRETLSQGLASAALREAAGRQRPSAGLIHMIPSISRSGNCYDNAYMESFWGTLKTELVHGERYRSRLEARLSIFEYVEVFYNRQRRHSALGYRSPKQYERLLGQT
jgi:putative transposase